jgi:DNA repair protein RadC
MNKTSCTQQIVRIQSKLALLNHDSRDPIVIKRLKNRLRYWQRKQRQSQFHGLYVRDAVGQYQVADLDTVKAAAFALSEQSLAHGVELSNKKIAEDALKLRLGFKRYEVFVAVFLDTRHRIIECVELFRGTLDGASVYPREVAFQALQFNASAVIFAHNHPSGASTPSQADKDITQQLREALALFKITVLDHFVIGSTVFSFAEHGLI